jgi:hypothetical protein
VPYGPVYSPSKSLFYSYNTNWGLDFSFRDASFQATTTTALSIRSQRHRKYPTAQFVYSPLIQKKLMNPYQ